MALGAAQVRICRNSRVFLKYKSLLVSLLVLLGGCEATNQAQDPKPAPVAVFKPTPQPAPEPTPAPAMAKTPPRGLSVALPVDDPKIATEVCWTDTNVQMVLLRTKWSSIEPSPGVFDWGYFDAGLALCQKYGKRAQMSINGGARYYPSWLSVQKWKTNKGGYSPCPWDPKLQTEVAKMIAVFGARYDENPLLSSVTMWAGGRGIETFFCQTPAQQKVLDAAGGPSIFITASEAIIDAYAKAFPTTPIYLATGNAYPDGRTTMTTIAKYMLSKYPNSGLQSCALSSRYPSGKLFPHTKIRSSKVRHIGFQFLLALTSPQMAGSTLETTLTNGLNYGAAWVQAYPTDPVTDPAAAAKFNSQARSDL